MKYQDCLTGKPRGDVVSLNQNEKFNAYQGLAKLLIVQRRFYRPFNIPKILLELHKLIKPKGQLANLIQILIKP